VFTNDLSIRLQEIKMATKKKAATASKAQVLKFNPEWIKDPVPPFFRRLDAAARRDLAAAKREFTAKVKEILVRGQR
jgi:hypothetical protein